MYFSYINENQHIPASETLNAHSYGIEKQQSCIEEHKKNQASIAVIFCYCMFISAPYSFCPTYVLHISDFM